MKWIIANSKKGLGNSHSLNTFAHIVIILNPAGKHMVKVNNRNIRNKRIMFLKLTIKNNSGEMFLESSISNLEQILHFDFKIRFYILCSNFAIVTLNN